MTTITTGNNTGSIQLTTVQTTTSSTTTKVQTFTVGETGYAFMRAKTVTFTAEGLKPNTQYYAFFNGVYVGEFCSQVSSPELDTTGRIKETSSTGVSQRVLKSNSIGLLVGNFYLPANTFVSGAHKFRLVDNVRTVSGSTIPDPLYGSAEAIYEANGVLKQQSTQITQDVTTTVTNQSTVVTPVAPAPVTPAPPPTPPVLPPPVVTCEKWYFQYSVTAAVTKEFTICSNTATPPATLPSPSTGNKVIAGTVRYISTTGGPAHWHHKYSYQSSSGSTIQYRQEWVGPTPTNVATDLPSLTNFRPTGIGANNVITITRQWTKVGRTACPVTYGLKTPTRVDPLAQSFFVDAAQYPEGLFVTSIAVYFKTVDQSTPVTLELRDMSNGLPGSNILPGGMVVVPGYAAASSPDASIATVFRFDSPIYLRPSTDYCFVIKSSSLGYNAWCSRMGEIDVVSGKVIDSQPFSGTLFKSENDVTWIPDSYEDMKFDLYKADFNTSIEGNMVFRPQKNTATNNYVGTAINLPLSYIQTTRNSNVVKLRLPLHSLSAGDTIYIEGIGTPQVLVNGSLTSSNTGYNGIPASQLNGEHVIALDPSDDDVVTFTTTATATQTGNLLVRDIYSLINTTPAVMPTYADIQAAVPFVDDSVIVPSTVQTETYNIVQPNPPTIISTNSFTVYTNIQANEVMIDYLGTELSSTTITELIKIATGQSSAGAETPYAYRDAVEIQRNGDFFSFDEPRMLATPRNEAAHHTALLDNPSAEVNLKFASGNKDISPIVNMDGMSITVRSYKIDNQSGEITALQANALKTITDFNDPTQNTEVAPGAGTAAAKYKSPVNVLTQAYNKIILFVTANCPAPAAIDAYIRTSTDTATHMDRNWTWAPINGVFGTAFKNSSTKSVVNEWMYELTSPEPFTVFDIKLVMRSTNNSVVPKIYGIRTIADNNI